MLRSGLVSITFRSLSAAEVLRLAAEAGLEGIEWGGDVHVPHGDIAAARGVRRLTQNAGLAVAAYGSYWRAGEAEAGPVEAVLDTAAELATPLVRVWAGKRGSAQADDAYRAAVVADCRRAAELAAVRGQTVVCEWHGGTLTDTPASALELLRAVGHASFRTYWQPPRCTSAEACLAGLTAARKHLAGLHVFSWHLRTAERMALDEAELPWRRYLSLAAGAGDMFALLEFVRNDDPQAFLRDAATLKRWLAAV
jgi:sugar phosphate isomerase/epimerase